ncbi:ABC transporter substrate-binding protein [Alphaproteobacteria bacterium]|nr:ABC transporter substrate-binding protein [Alphaproteobacteria bacterium]
MKKILLALSILLIVGVSYVFLHNGDHHGEKLRIGASPLPHAEILNFVKEDLEKSGIDLEIIEFTDYVTPNLALNEKQIDANFFQHKPYLDSFIKEHGVALVSLIAVHIEPQGLYSQKVRNVSDLEDGATIAIPNDPTNEGRALLLLQANGIIQLKAGVGFGCTPFDIISNPKNLKFKELEAAQLPRVLADVDGAIITGNYAIEAKLKPLEDALLLEAGDSLYANVIAIRREMKDDPRFQKLIKLLKTDKVRQYILHTYGGIIPAF